MHAEGNRVVLRPTERMLYIAAHVHQNTTKIPVIRWATPILGMAVFFADEGDVAAQCGRFLVMAPFQRKTVFVALMRLAGPARQRMRPCL